MRAVPSDSPKLARLRWTVRTSRAARENRAFAEALETLLVCAAEAGEAPELDALAAVLDASPPQGSEQGVQWVSELLRSHAGFGDALDAV